MVALAVRVRYGLRPDGALDGSEPAHAGFGALSSYAARLASWLSLRSFVRRVGWLADRWLFVTSQRGAQPVPNLTSA